MAIGYRGFTNSKSQRDHVIQYIMNQETHLKEQTFREEYMEMLRNSEMEYDEKIKESTI